MSRQASFLLDDPSSKKKENSFIMEETCLALLTSAVLALNLNACCREYRHFLVFVPECQHVRASTGKLLK
jgi:hypothetical protein